MKKVGFLFQVLIVFFAVFVSCSDDTEKLQTVSSSFDIKGEDSSSDFDRASLKKLMIAKINEDVSSNLRKSNLTNLIDLNGVKVIEDNGESYVVAEWKENSESYGFLAKILNEQGGVVLFNHCISRNCFCSYLCECTFGEWGSCAGKELPHTH